MTNQTRYCCIVTLLLHSKYTLRGIEVGFMQLPVSSINIFSCDYTASVLCSLEFSKCRIASKLLGGGGIKNNVAIIVIANVKVHLVAIFSVLLPLAS
jgi:hypothetical protein